MTPMFRREIKAAEDARAIDPDGLEAEARSLAPCFQREIERRFADRRRRDAVLFGGVERRVEERRER